MIAIIEINLDMTGPKLNIVYAIIATIVVIVILAIIMLLIITCAYCWERRNDSGKEKS